MKTLIKLTISASLLIAGGLAISATSARAATSYPLSCRGGAGTLGYNSQTDQALFYFTNTSGPAGQGLTPGQCAWVDRSVGVNEPTCLTQYSPVTSAWIFPSNRSASYFSSTSSPWLRNLLEPNNFQVFQVYNPGNGGCFIVTRLGS